MRVSDELTNEALFDVYCMVSRIREGCGREELAGLARRLHHELTRDASEESNNSSESRSEEIARVGKGDQERAYPFLQPQTRR